MFSVLFCLVAGWTVARQNFPSVSHQKIKYFTKNPNEKNIKNKSFLTPKNKQAKHPTNIHKMK
jgi:hypothetical protein